jgi:putative inorganic carbon (HCO3(-)) transporter
LALDGRLAIRWSRTGPRPLPTTEVAVGLAATGLALAVAIPPPELAAGLALGAILIVLSLIEPLVALTALLAAVPVSTLVAVEAGDFSVTAIEPLMVLLVMCWLVRGIANDDLKISGGPLLVPLGLVVMVVMASSLAAERLGLAYKEAIKWLELLIVFAFTATWARSERRQRAILVVLFLAGTGEALYGVFQYASGIGPAAFTVGEALRAYGNFEQPNPFAGYLGTILPLALAAAAWALASGRFGFALLGCSAVLGCGAGILLSLSRGAWVGVMLALAVMLASWSQASRHWLAPAVGVLVLLVLLTATNLLPGGWSDRLVAVAENFGVFDVRTVQVSNENFAVVERMAHWQAGWYMLLDHPLLGVGAGNYPAAYDRYSLPGWREHLGHAHNYYLNMAAEAGLPGGLAFLALMIATYITIIGGLRRRSSSTFRHALLVGLFGSFVVLTVHNLFDNLLVHGMQVQVGALLGLIAVASEQRVDNAGTAS